VKKMDSKNILNAKLIANHADIYIVNGIIVKNRFGK
jgi:hypothetical protein